MPIDVNSIDVIHSAHFVSVIAEKALDDVNLTKLPSDEGTVVYNNEPGPEKYVSATHYFQVLL